METTTALSTESGRPLPLHQPLPIIVPVQVLDDERVSLTRPFYVVVEQTDDNFIATFFDAHISASGETQWEAVDNVKDLVVATFHRLRQAPADKLGPIPTRQIAALRHFISMAAE
ncbi:MAG TPA: hypothetical protein VGG06_22390 [Thermoanaerobaculia bacterium]|jgi:hypothetical protein